MHVPERGKPIGRFLVRAVWLALCIASHGAWGEIDFRIDAARIEGLPENFLACSPVWTVADTEGRGKGDLLLAGIWGANEGILVIRSAEGELSVVSQPWRRKIGADLQPSLQLLNHCDIDNDGRDEVFLLGRAPESNRMLQWQGSTLVEKDIPFPVPGDSGDGLARL
jgi:hypothetical protein